MVIVRRGMVIFKEMYGNIEEMDGNIEEKLNVPEM